jgi:hypothetical protein
MTNSASKEALGKIAQLKLRTQNSAERTLFPSQENVVS